MSPAGNILLAAPLLAAPLRAALLSLTVDADSGCTGWSGGVDWQGADSVPEADANSYGVSNLLAYALDLPPLAASASGALPAVALDTVAPGGPWLSMLYRKNNYADDLVYAVQASTDLSAWSDLVVDGVSVVSEIAAADPDGDGSASLRRVRLVVAANEPSRFLRLRVIR